MPIDSYAKESIKSVNETSQANKNATLLHSSANESIDRTTVANNTNGGNQATIIDEKPVKNHSEVFRGIDAKKIQSNTKDIEDGSTNILQSRRNTYIDSTTTTTTSTSTPPPITTTIAASETTTKSAAHPISESVNDASTTERSNLFHSNQQNVANIQTESEVRVVAEAEVLSQKRHRRHRQQRYISFNSNVLKILFDKEKSI